MNFWTSFTEWVNTNLTSLFPKLNYWVTILIVVIIVAAIVWFVVSAKRISWKPSLITEIAIACALSLILGFLKIVQMPEGGSISLAMLPVIVVAFRRGLVPGVVTGIIAGLLQMICDPFFIHPLQVLLDYPFAWGALGLAGVVVTEKSRKNFTWIIGVLAVILVAIGASAFVIQTNGTSIMWDKFVMIAILAVFLSASLFIANKKLHKSIMIIAGITLILALVFAILYHVRGFAVPWYMYVIVGLLISLFISMFFFKNNDFNQKIGAVAFGSLGRFLFHFASGVVFFSQFAPEGFSIAGYVALYIFTHLFFEAFVCLLVIVPLQRSSNLMEYQESDKVSV